MLSVLGYNIPPYLIPIFITAVFAYALYIQYKKHVKANPLAFLSIIIGSLSFQYSILKPQIYPVTQLSSTSTTVFGVKLNVLLLFSMFLLVFGVLSLYEFRK